jgi:hypothetical protein
MLAALQVPMGSYVLGQAPLLDVPFAATAYRVAWAALVGGGLLGLLGAATWHRARWALLAAAVLIGGDLVGVAALVLQEAIGDRRVALGLLAACHLLLLAGLVRNAITMGRPAQGWPATPPRRAPLLAAATALGVIAALALLLSRLP